MKSLARELRDTFSRWVERELRHEWVSFIGGPLNEQKMRLPRGLSEWIQPTREGDVRYVAKRRISGTYYVLDSLADRL